MIKPMLLSDAKNNLHSIHKRESVFIQPKLDGWRCVANSKTGRLYSRTGKEIILPHISQDIINQDGLPEWLDGELYVHGAGLPGVSKLIKAQSDRVQFCCFDAITRDIFSDRLLDVYRITDTPNIMVVPADRIKPQHINTIYQKYLDNGYEGAVIRFDELYFHGRSDKIFKLKPAGL